MTSEAIKAGIRCPEGCDCWLEDADPEQTGAKYECPYCGVWFTDECHLCERAIPLQEGPDLCDRCKATAQAHARLENDARRYPDPEPRHQR